MAFCSKLSGLVRATLKRNSVSFVNAPNMQMFNAIRYMATKVYVGGLSYDTDEGSLRSAFEGFGEVSEAFVISDRDTGRSKGFGFVSYLNDDSANKAISAMDGKELDGRQIRVNVANERPPRVGGYGGGGGGYGGGGGGYGGGGGGYGGGGY
ncbi:Glycine-rich RNA-binding protein 4, mitochondrial [Zostera marina]|uniref:Glycine-rich RNA-binding protein 4, mitochondrial n=1 Tax=Zostera marina TaxID=29655 RepID=A0A0K9NVP5_ZOSMR|nr:Glycine-rich RNA-binding protein 4, mitochondrial [Zostera marina]